jgi:hypothetical protein
MLVTHLASPHHALGLPTRGGDDRRGAPRKRLTMLRVLVLRECDRIADVSALAALTQLQRLELSHCISIADFSALIALTQLQCLDNLL